MTLPLPPSHPPVRIARLGPRALRARTQTPQLLPTILGVYGTVGALAATVSVALGRDPIAMPSWVGLDGAAGLAWSAGLGVILAVATVAATRLAVRRAAWARTLHAELRPAVRDVGGWALFAMATASGVAEELFFRGLLLQLVGVVLSALAFGLLHQTRGASRWVWAAWASGMGLLFGCLFALTGSLVGPMIAHVAINAVNLRFLRDHDV